MSWHETTLNFECGNELLHGVLAKPSAPGSDLGVLIIVGGPQYRSGSHRQFTLLARTLAAAGYPSLRFDYRGMGDSSGELHNFENVSDDIGAAIDALCATGVQRVMLWGLCDAASAALLYCDDRPEDRRVVALNLLNPWVRTPQGLAKAHVKQYYLQRLRQREFWGKLLSPSMWRRAVPEFLLNVRLAFARRQAVAVSHKPFQGRMARAWRGFEGDIQLTLSGQDFTAREFIEHAAADPDWRSLLNAEKCERVELPEADHTFSDRRQSLAVEAHCLRFANALTAARPSA